MFGSHNLRLFTNRVVDRMIKVSPTGRKLFIKVSQINPAAVNNTPFYGGLLVYGGIVTEAGKGKMQLGQYITTSLPVLRV